MQKICTKSMKIQLKIAVVAGLMALLITSCQKEDIPMPGVTPVEQNGGGNMRVGGPNDNNGGSLGDDNVISADSTGIVSGGDDDRDGGIVGGGDDDKDGGSKKAEPKKN
jgi:hypothetical protein